MLPVGLYVPVEGLYSSALAGLRVLLSASSAPPITKTSAFASNVAVWLNRGVDMPPLHARGVHERSSVGQGAASGVGAGATLPSQAVPEGGLTSTA
jgi:hypothetical protein